MAKHFGVSDGVVYYWIEHGLVQARRQNHGRPYWITMSTADEEKLRAWVRGSKKLQNGKASLNDIEGGAL